MATPNWSYATAANERVAFFETVAGSGLTETVVAVWFTLTVTLLVVVSEPSLIVTRNV
jgi:hypothetical protein